ncbi:MAG TPA: hypothetical protein DC057_17325 [Spirochaetia bacterium]|nr:hypothetical protein [Spirochaetia bacterium]
MAGWYETGKITGDDIGDRIKSLKQQKEFIEYELEKANEEKVPPAFILKDENIEAFQRISSRYFSVKTRL